jgi:hypothetical protein
VLSGRAGQWWSPGTETGAVTLSIFEAYVMAEKKDEHTEHSLASKFAKALLKVRPARIADVEKQKEARGIRKQPQPSKEEGH